MVGLTTRKVSPHIAEYEVRDKWTGEIKISPHIVYLFESVREELGKPIIITSGYRSEKYQAYLRAIGYPAAIVSPHCYGAALDMLFPFSVDKDGFANLFVNHSLKLDYGICRIGRKQYGDTFLHVDVVYLLFEPYTTIQNPKPDTWKPGVAW